MDRLKNKKAQVIAVILFFLLVGIVSYLVGTYYKNLKSVSSNEKINTVITPTVNPSSTPSAQDVTQTPSVEAIATPTPTITNTPTPTKSFIIPNIRKVVTSTPTPTSTFQIPNIRKTLP